MSLRDEIANVIGDSLGWPKDRRSSFVVTADRILAIPELERAGEAVARLRELFKRMEPFRGASGAEAELALTQMIAAELKSLQYLLEKPVLVAPSIPTREPLSL